MTLHIYQGVVASKGTHKSLIKYILFLGDSITKNFHHGEFFPPFILQVYAASSEFITITRFADLLTCQ